MNKRSTLNGYLIAGLGLALIFGLAFLKGRADK